MKANWELVPSHIISVILSKLPATNLPVCRVVGKIWNESVLHFNSTHKFPNTLFVGMDTKFQIHAFNFEESIHSTGVTHPTLDLEAINLHASLKFDPNWLHTQIINACNGLLLCRFFPNQPQPDIDVAILNPMTNEHIKVTDCDDEIYAHGFGFSPNTKQYKLVRILGVGDIFRGTTRVEIFGYGGSENWRLVDSGSFRVSRTNGVYSNGFLYWFGTTNEFTKTIICRLDVEEERFEFMALPVDEGFCNEAIKVCNDNVYVTMIVGLRFQVWMMQGNGGWVRYFVGDGIRVDLEVKRNELHHPQIVQVFEDGEILILVYGLHLFFYNPYTGRLTPNFDYTLTTTIITPPLHHIPSFSFHPLQDILRGHSN